MATKEKILKAWKNFPANLRESSKEKTAARKSKRGLKKNVTLLGITQAKKRYKAKTGKEMTPSFLKLEQEGGKPAQTTIDYMKDRDTTVKKLRKQYGIKSIFNPFD